MDLFCGVSGLFMYCTYAYKCKIILLGVLDAESSFMEHSEEFFDNLRTFRSTNKDECVSSRPVRLV